EGVTLAAIWLTHHHHDHVGGVPELVAAHPALAVVIGAVDAAKVAHVTHTIVDGDAVTLDGLHFIAIHNPGHTLGATSLFGEGSMFTGDTLFGGGCGRVFEGDAAMMHASLERLGGLAPETRVYFGHEYTASNLRFAAAVEPGNLAIAQRAATGSASTGPSTPSTIGLARATNPFLRATEPEVIEAAVGRGAGRDPVAVFAAIREWKNSF
ncbi:MAG: hydroxyacylglutathione hydrolase, partial [Proteobacteria bacterium]|nr:hydroxyacylglutathione hydrolase [Pseudomonadota bacterium]